MKATVDKDTCIGCGLCTSTSPEVFHIENDGKSVGSVVSAEHENEARDAESSCPVSAISIS